MADDAYSGAASVEELCRLLHPQLFGALRLYLGDRGLAEELAQDTLVRMLERGDQVVAMEHPEGWAYRVAFNLARSRLRRLGAERRANAKAGAAPTQHDGVDVASRVTMRAALAQLPARQRQAVVLRYFADLPVAEVAQTMGCRPATAKAHLRQAMATLRSAGLAHDQLTDTVDLDTGAEGDECR